MTASIALPRIMRVGGGASAELPDVLSSLGCSRPLIVTDPFIAEQPFLGQLLASLEQSDMAPAVFSDTTPDPTTESVRLGTRALRDGDFDCVVGIGGGSSMDTAKAIALLGTGGTEMRDYKAPAVTDVPTLPVIAVPTTAGSGSECTRFTIITDSETDEKMLCAGLAFLPQAALVDYDFTMAMPPRLTADTGMDALVHAIEAYVSVKASPLTDTWALAAMRTISANIRTVYTEPSDRRAREAMMLGATQAGLAFSNSSVALVHGMSRPIGAHFHVAHGLSNAMLMPTITEFSISGAPDRYADCARAMGIADPAEPHGSSAARLVDELHRLNEDLAVPTPRKYGITERRWHELVPFMASQAHTSGSPGNNPRVPTTAEIEDLYRSLWS